MPLRAASRVPVDENIRASGAEEAGAVKKGAPIRCPQHNEEEAAQVQEERAGVERRASSRR